MISPRSDCFIASDGRFVPDQAPLLSRMTPKSIEVGVSPSVLVWARTSSGLSVAETARRAGIRGDELGSWEAGGESPTISKLERLANAYHRPLAAFLLVEPPSEVVAPPDLRVVADRVEESPFSEKTLLAIRRARRVQKLASDLELAGPGPLVSHLRRVAAPLSASEAAVRVAAEIQAYSESPPRFETPYLAMAHWRALLEGLGILVLQFPMPVDDARGFTLSGDSWPVLVVNQSDTPKARNFTLFHEFGHILLRREGVCDLGGEPTRGKSPRLEIWCNAFAGALLVPETSLLAQIRTWPSGEEPPDDEIERLSNHFQVSETVVLRRLLAARVLSQPQYQALVELRRPSGHRQTRAAAGGMKRNVPLERVSEYGAPFVDLVLKNAYEGRLLLGDVAEILDVQLKHLPAISERAAAVLART